VLVVASCARTNELANREAVKNQRNKRMHFLHG
jgi:hypothetical protein